MRRQETVVGRRGALSLRPATSPLSGQVGASATLISNDRHFDAISAAGLIHRLTLPEAIEEFLWGPLQMIKRAHQSE